MFVTLFKKEQILERFITWENKTYLHLTNVLFFKTPDVSFKSKTL